MASASSIDAWEKFFKACEVPVEVRKKYAATFVKQRMVPHLLRDLSKEDLRELGVTTMGDQLAIIRYVKLCDGNPPEFGSSAKQQRSHQVEETYSDEDEPMEQQPRSKAPDRDDVYHIKMPDGRLPRTRNILEVHSALKEQGFIKRGVSGIRRSGIELRGVVGQSKTIVKKSPTTKAIVVQDTGVTSSTGGGFVPLGTLRSDMISNKTIVVKDEGSPRKNQNAVANRLSTSGVPIQVKINTMQQHLRKVVTYGDDFMQEGGEQVGMNPSNLPIAHRIQLVAGRRPPITSNRSSQKMVTTSTSRMRPIVTVAGRKIDLGAAKRIPARKNQRVIVAGGGSILDRITVTK